MSERYKVLGAVLALKEFNVSDIAKFSGVKQNTVRTVLMREASLFDELGKEQSRSKGGQFARYRLKSNKVADLRSEIRQLYDTLDRCIDYKINESNSEGSITLPVLTAEDALLLRVPTAGDTRVKVELIKFAETVERQQISPNRRVANVAGQPSEELIFHLHSLRTLIDFCNAELVTESNPGLKGYVAPIFCDLFHSLLKRGQQLGEVSYCVRLLDRFLTSPLVSPTVQNRGTLDDSINLTSVLEGSSDPEAAEFLRQLRNLRESIGTDHIAVATEATENVLVDAGSHQYIDSARFEVSALGGSVSPGKLPLSISIETYGGIATRIFDRNTPLPTKMTETFSTAADNQTEVEVHLLQGERPMAAQNRTLGKFKLSGLPPAHRGVPQIEVSFDIDSDGILNVTAKDNATGKNQRVTVTSGSDLTKEEADRMAKEAEVHAAEDKELHEQIEVRNSLDSLAYNIEKMLKETRGKVQDTERSEIESALADARRALGSNPSTLKLKAEQEKLTTASHKLAEVLYRINIAQASSPDSAGAATGESPIYAEEEENAIEAEYFDLGDWK